MNGLRVIALEADPPSVPAGGTTTIKAVIPPFQSDGGAPALEWAMCTRPGVAALGETVNPDCIDNQTADYLIPLGSGETVSVTMPPVAPQDLGVPDATGGVYLPVRLRASAGGKTVIAVYRLRLALPGEPLNHNPVIDGINSIANDGTRLTLRATATPESYETYATIDPQTGQSTTTTETIRFFWYASAGAFGDEVTGDTAAPDQTLSLDQHPPAPGSTFDLYVVAHDERGGTSHAHRTVTAGRLDPTP